MNWLLLTGTLTMQFCVPQYPHFETKALCENARAWLEARNKPAQYKCVPITKTAK